MDSASQRITDAMLRRGFLVYEKDGDIYFDEKPHPGDYDYFSRIINLAIPNPGVSENCVTVYTLENDKLVQIPGASQVVDTVCKALLSEPARECLRGSYGYDYMDYDRLRTWQSFKDLRYGVKVPLIMLDPGVALMVKVMPWYGIATSMSCEGHIFRGETCYQRAPHISFIGTYHGRWAETVLKCICADLSCTSEWIFEHDHRNKSSVWYAWSRIGDLSEEEHAQAVENVYQAALRLMQAGLDDELRELKDRITDDIELDCPEILIDRYWVKKLRASRRIGISAARRGRLEIR